MPCEPQPPGDAGVRRMVAGTGRVPLSDERAKNLSVERGFLAGLATFPLDLPREISVDSLLVFACDESYDFLFCATDISVSATLYCADDRVNHYRLRIESPTDVFEVNTRIEGNVDYVKSRLVNLRLYAQRDYDGALCEIPRLSEECQAVVTTLRIRRDHFLHFHLHTASCAITR